MRERGSEVLNLFSLSLSPSLPLSTPPLPISLYLLPPSLFSLLHLSLPSLPLFLHLPSYLSQSLTQSVTSSFNILQYFPYLDHFFSLTQPCCSLHSLACSIFHIIFSYLDHLELYIKVRLNTRPSYQRQQKFGRGPVVHKTRVLRGTSNPQWREDFMVRGPQ